MDYFIAHMTVSARINGRMRPVSMREMMRALIMVMVAILAVLPLNVAKAQGVETYEQPPVNYSSTESRDPLVPLMTRLTSGETIFTGPAKETVQRLLKELHIPVESQMLVFSKTSFQRSRIRPDHPRAVYFSDTCYVGWVPGGLIEVAAVDPQLGPVFYGFDPNETQPKFTRNNDCLSCHGGSFVRGIPGVFVRSVFTDGDGEMLLRHGSEVVDFRTPFTNRWAGWYVTGKHGTALHRGNVFAREQDTELVVDFKHGANVSDLSPYFETKSYLTAGSDIVALMVFEHQTAMQNTLTRASHDCRRMLAYQKNLQVDLKEPVTAEPTYESVKRVFDSTARDVVDDLLFKGEARLPQGIQGSASFQNAFCAEARRDRDGRSLKDFDLQGRLFQNRCSYLIYSESFLLLPEILKQKVYARLVHALHPTQPDPQYAYLGADERRRISTILQQTHPEFRKASGL